MSFFEHVGNILPNKKSFRAYKGESEPAVPPYQGGKTIIGGREVSTNQKVGNDIVTSYNPSANVQAANDVVEGQLPTLYKNALTPQDFTSYANNLTQNQLDLADKAYRRQLNTAKGALVSSGQSSSSQGLDQLTPFNEAYQSQLASINAETPIQAQQMQSNQQNLNTSQMSNAINALNNYYNTGNTFMGTASNASTSGNNYNQQNYQNQLAAQQAANQNMLGYGKLGLGLIGTGLNIYGATKGQKLA